MQFWKKRLMKIIMILSAIGFIIAILITLKIRTIDYQQDELFIKAWKGRIMETIF